MSSEPSPHPTASGSAAGRRLVARLPDVLSIAVALVLWRLFFPALMSADSITQYGQALTRSYSDWHPPLMSIVLSLVLIAGGTVGLFMLFQCLAGVFGIRALTAAVLELLYGPKISPRRAEWLSLLALLLLLLPVTPLAFYLMTLWKDVWAMVLLLWLAAVLLRHAATPEGETRRAAAKEILIVLSLAVALGLVRHNAIVVLPVVGWILWSWWRQRLGRAGALALLVAPLLLCLAADVLIAEVFHVQKARIGRTILALDLLGVCAADAQACDRLPFTKSHLVAADFASRYPVGDTVTMVHGEPSLVAPDFYALSNYERLRSEYVTAARRFPWLLAKVKLEAFVTLLGKGGTSYFFHDTIVDNPYGLVLNTRFQAARRRLSEITAEAAVHPLGRWLSAVHLVWLVGCLLWIVGLVAGYRISGEPRCWRLAQVLCLPLAFYLSYLPAVSAHDFRFMYPATLAVQCVTVAALAGALAQNPIGRNPKRFRLST